MKEDAGSRGFGATLEEENGVLVVIAYGELDLLSAPIFRDALDKAIERSGSSGGVVVDLRQVEFMESTTLGILVGQRKELRGSGKELALVIGGDEDNPVEHPAGRILGLTGQAVNFSIYTDRAAAVESVSDKG